MNSDDKYFWLLETIECNTIVSDTIAWVIIT